VPASRLPSDLCGVWSLDRTVRDGLAGPAGTTGTTGTTGIVGTVVGELTVVDHGRRIGLHEAGVLSWDGRLTPVERTTYLELRDGEVWATFADGRLFHPWRPGEDVVHPCGEDTYVGRVDRDGDVLRTVWRVTGPAKDQLLTTELRRR
jgi:hypothetical protein